MNRMPAGFLSSLLLLGAACAEGTVSPFQEEPLQSQPIAKAEPRKGTIREGMTVQFKVTLEGETVIPPLSSVELKAGGPDCEKLDRVGMLDAGGLVTVSKIPVCKVAVWILITGLDSKVIVIDLVKYKDREQPIQILLGKEGQVTVQN